VHAFPWYLFLCESSCFPSPSRYNCVVIVTVCVCAPTSQFCMQNRGWKERLKKLMNQLRQMYPLDTCKRRTRIFKFYCLHLGGRARAEGGVCGCGCAWVHFLRPWGCTDVVRERDIMCWSYIIHYMIQQRISKFASPSDSEGHNFSLSLSVTARCASLWDLRKSSRESECEI
jgi:hypothetical protein